MDLDIKSEWTTALRSDEFAQGRGALRTINNEYCCLGVLCELASRAGVGKWEKLDSIDLYGFSTTKDDGSVVVLPKAVQEWAGLDDETVSIHNAYGSLSAINDDGISFKKIADIIDENF